MKTRRYYIYGLFEGEQCRYIGATSNYARRIKEHRLRGHMKKNPKLEPKILCKCIGPAQAAYGERRMIALLKPSINKHPGGGAELNTTLEQHTEAGRKAWQTRIENLASKLASNDSSQFNKPN
jgi:hypothetical protein